MPPIQDLPLRDIHLPESIGWFPPAIGWWVVAVLIFLITYFVIALIQYLHQKRAIKEAKKLLKQLQRNDSLTHLEKICEISILLRRVAINDNQKAGGLTGRAWLDYLDSSLKVKDTSFKYGIGRCLANAPYQKQLTADVDLPALFQLAQTWLNAQTVTQQKKRE